MEVALAYLLEAVMEEEEMDEEFLTLLGLTHSAWWERSLKEGIGLAQNSQGSITVSVAVSASLAELVVSTGGGRLRAELTMEELVDLQTVRV